MSLDVHLSGKVVGKTPCPHCDGRGYYDEIEGEYSSNITHNLGRMARAAGIYEACWRPEEIGITHARQLIAPLAAGLEKLRSNPDQFKAYDAPNGWGTYEHFVPWVEQYLQACKENPESEVSVSR